MNDEGKFDLISSDISLSDIENNNHERADNILISDEFKSFKSLIKKVELKVEGSYSSNDAEFTPSKAILRLIEKSKGSLELQKILPSLSVKLCDFMFESIKVDYFLMLKTLYANYFAQLLFIYFGFDNRSFILQRVCNDIEYFIDNKYGECSVLFILENDLTSKEQSYILSQLKPKMFKLMLIPSFLRITECLIALYPFTKINYIINYALDNINDFIVSKEGYFLIRMIIKSCKDRKTQEKILKKISADLSWFLSSSNGVLICQSFIHNIPLKAFTFTKSCSKHVSEEVNIKSKDNYYDMKNQLLLKFLILLIENIDYWDNSNFQKVIFCALEVSNEAFEDALMNYTEKKKVYRVFMNLTVSFDLLKEIESCFTKSSFDKLIIDLYSILTSCEMRIDKSLKKFITDKFQKIQKVDQLSNKSKYSSNPLLSSYTSDKQEIKFNSNNLIPTSQQIFPILPPQNAFLIYYNNGYYPGYYNVGNFPAHQLYPSLGNVQVIQTSPVYNPFNSLSSQMLNSKKARKN